MILFNDPRKKEILRCLIAAMVFVREQIEHYKKDGSRVFGFNPERGTCSHIEDKLVELLGAKPRIKEVMFIRRLMSASFKNYRNFSGNIIYIIKDPYNKLTAEEYYFSTIDKYADEKAQLRMDLLYDAILYLEKLL